MKTAYIQTRPDGQILNQGNYTAYYGFLKLGYKIQFYPNAIQLLGLLGDNPNLSKIIIVGGIDTLREILFNLEVLQPEVPKPHVVLPQFLKREMKEMTLKEFIDYSNSDSFKPTFIKPLEEDKTFTGFVFKHKKDAIPLKPLPWIFKLLTSEVVELQSEFRVFVQDRKILDCKNYTGNFWLRPNPHIIQEAIDAYTNQHIAYTLDWGIDLNGNTILIEINDAFGVAPYGLDPVKYARFLEARFQEIITIKHYNETI